MNSSIYKTPSGEKEIMALYDAVLNNWPVPYETKMIKTRHGDTFVIASGDETAPALVLLHGAASNAVSWVGDVAEYSRHFRVYAVDLPGEPGKSSPNRPPLQDMSYTEWMDNVLSGLEIQKAILLGLSQGGWTAIRYASCCPERIIKLVLLTPAGIVPTKVSFILKAVLLSAFGRRGVERLNRIVFGKQAVHPDAIKFMNVIMRHFKSRIEKEYIFTDDELKKLQMPVLLICGEKDAVRSAGAIEQRMRKLVPRLQSVIMPEMGHVLVNLTQSIIPFIKATKN